MEITKKTENGKVVLMLKGKLNTATAPQLAQEIKSCISDGAERLDIDMTDLVYISSDGIRVLFTTYKTLGNNLTIMNVNSVIKDILDMVGLNQFINIR